MPCLGGSEEWRSVPGFDAYEVSNLGRVRSLDRVAVDSIGRSRSLRGSLLTPIENRARRTMFVNLGSGNPRRIAQLVLEAFVGPRPHGQGALHWDDDHYNNRLENLRWGSDSDNRHDAVRNGRHPMTKKTHCKRGHEFTPENTLKNSSGGRRCGECRKVTG